VHGIKLEAIKLPETKRGFVFLPAALGSQAVLCLSDTVPAAGGGHAPYASTSAICNSSPSPASRSNRS
jgi:hypothetical protein